MSKFSRVLGAVLAGAQILTAGTALADVIGLRYAALIALCVGAGQAGLAAYNAGESKPQPSR